MRWLSRVLTAALLNTACDLLLIFVFLWFYIVPANLDGICAWMCVGKIFFFFHIKTNLYPYCCRITIVVSLVTQWLRFQTSQESCFVFLFFLSHTHMLSNNRHREYFLKMELKSHRFSSLPPLPPWSVSGNCTLVSPFSLLPFCTRNSARQTRWRAQSVHRKGSFVFFSVIMCMFPFLKPDNINDETQQKTA